MALLRDLIGFSTLIVLLCSVPANGDTNFTAMDKDLIAFALNLEYFEAEFFLNGALGYGLDKQAPMLAAGGPAPIGPEKAVLDPTAYELVAQMGLQEVGHLRFVTSPELQFMRGADY